MIILHVVNLFPTQFEELVLHTPGHTPHSSSAHPLGAARQRHRTRRRARPDAQQRTDAAEEITPVATASAVDRTLGLDTGAMSVFDTGGGCPRSRRIQRPERLLGERIAFLVDRQHRWTYLPRPVLRQVGRQRRGRNAQGALRPWQPCVRPYASCVSKLTSACCCSGHVTRSVAASYRSARRNSNPGESFLDAARRGLLEGTRLPGGAVIERYSMVARATR
jgi:hypothetical protein